MQLQPKNSSCHRRRGCRYFLDCLSPRRPEGCVRGRQLLHEIKLRGYTSSFSYLERVLVTRQRRQSRNIASGCRADGADVDHRDSPSRRRSRDRVIYLANCRGHHCVSSRADC